MGYGMFRYYKSMGLRHGCIICPIVMTVIVGSRNMTSVVGLFVKNSSCAPLWKRRNQLPGGYPTGGAVTLPMRFLHRTGATAADRRPAAKRVRSLCRPRVL